MGANYHARIKQMLASISDMIAEADECKTEISHIKKYHNELTSEDLTAQFRFAERARHIEQIEQRLEICLAKLRKHQQSSQELIKQRRI